MSNQLAAARQRVLAYINRRKIAKGLDIERVHCFDNEFDLLLSDLEALAAHEAAKPDPVAFVPADDLAPFLTYGGSFLANDHPRDDSDVPLYAAPVAVASPWMPIETAPKDGEVLIYVTETDEQFVAYWDEGWRFSRNAKLKSPTHWMPLPPAPEMKP